MVLLIRVTLPPFDKYKRFQPANFLSIFSKIGFHIDLSLKLAPKGRPRYFKGKEPCLQSRTFSNKSILWTTPTLGFIFLISLIKFMGLHTWPLDLWFNSTSAWFNSQVGFLPRLGKVKI